MHRKCLNKKGWEVFHALKGIILDHGFMLAGGTALALQMGHRVSLDLDLFTEKRFRVDSFIKEIEKTGLGYRVIAEDAESLTCIIEGIKVSMLFYPYPFIEEKVLCDGVPLASVLDIASMKVVAVSQRGTKRDFVDLYRILQDLPFHKVAANMVARFGPERINPVYTGKSLVYFANADSDPEPEYLTKGEKWLDVKKFFRGHVKQFVLDLQGAIESSKGN